MNLYWVIEIQSMRSAYWKASVCLFVCCLAALYSHMVWQPSSDRLRRSLESGREKGERREGSERELTNRREESGGMQVRERGGTLPESDNPSLTLSLHYLHFYTLISTQACAPTQQWWSVVWAEQSDFPPVCAHQRSHSSHKLLVSLCFSFLLLIAFSVYV